MLHKICPRDLASNCCTKKVAKRCCTRFPPQSWRGNVAQQIGQYDRDTKRFATRCCTRFGPTIAAPKRWPRDATQDLLQRSSEQCCPQIWQDDRCTRRLATRCCTRFGPEIWPATAAPKLVSSSSPPPLLFSSSLPPLPSSSSSSHPPHLLVAKRCCTRFAPEMWRAMMHHKFGQTIVTQKGSPQDAAQDSARRSDQSLIMKPRGVAQALLQRYGEQCRQQIWQDDRCTRRFATSCCMRFGWRSGKQFLHQGYQEMLHKNSAEIWRAMLHHTFGQTIAAQKGSPQDAAQDSARRSGQQLLHGKGGQETVHNIYTEISRTMFHHKLGQTIATQKGSPQDAAQGSARRSAQQLMHKTGGQKMQHKICFRDLA